jgi:hypothetical protein
LLFPFAFVHEQLVSFLCAEKAGTVIALAIPRYFTSISHKVFSIFVAILMSDPVPEPHMSLSRNTCVSVDA